MTFSTSTTCTQYHKGKYRVAVFSHLCVCVGVLPLNQGMPNIQEEGMHLLMISTAKALGKLLYLVEFYAIGRRKQKNIMIQG